MLKTKLLHLDKASVEKSNTTLDGDHKSRYIVSFSLSNVELMELYSALETSDKQTFRHLKMALYRANIKMP